MILDIFAPIVPFEGMGGIKLYSTRAELWSLLEMKGVNSRVLYDEWIEYNIQNYVQLLFHIKNNKLFQISTLDNYKGKLFGKIGVGMTEQELVKLEPTFVYDDFEEVWESKKGIFVETDGETNRIRWISVFIPEVLDMEKLEKGDW